MSASYLPEDELLVRLAFEELPQPLVIIDPALRVVFSNSEAKQLRLGLGGLGPLCQANQGDCQIGCDPRITPCILRKAVLERSPQQARWRRNGGSNGGGVSELKAVPLWRPGSGAFLGVAVTVRDLTAEAQWERLVSRALDEWQSTADAVPDPILLVGADRRVLRCNRAARFLIGGPDGAVAGRGVADLFSGACDAGALEGQRAEIHWQRPRVLLDLSKHPVSLAESEPSEVWVLRDITAVRRLESLTASLDAFEPVSPTTAEPRITSAGAPTELSDALAAHFAWKRGLREFVDGRGEMPGSLLVERDDLCLLGVWIHGAGSAQASHPAYAELRSAHAAFHLAAARIVRAVEWGGRSQAKELLAAGGVYANRSVGIIAAMLRMGARVVDWDRQLDLGSEALDDAHHRELSALLGSLEEAARAKAPRDEMAAVLMHLMSHATDRFEAEHDLMRIAKYERSRLEEHVEAHNYFLDQILRLQEACSGETVGLLSRTVETLRPWLVDHGRVLDAALGQHLAEAHLVSDEPSRPKGGRSMPSADA